MRTRIYSRSGYTLIELVTVITVSAILLGISATLLSKLQHLSTSDTNKAGDLTARLEFGRVFRRDVHRAANAVFDAAGDSVALQGDDVQVAYAFNAGVLRRSVDGRPGERVTLGADWDVDWTVTDNLVRMDCICGADGVHAPWTVDAALGQTSTGGRQ